MNGVNANTIVVPLTVIASVVVATWFTTNYLNTKFNESRFAQYELGGKMEKLDSRLTSVEQFKVSDRWSSVDMFKWAVHLQQNNPQLKVPEPKHEE